MNRLVVCLLALVGSASGSGAVPSSVEDRSSSEEGTSAKTIVKLATLVPDGSIWDKAFRKMGSEWKRDTDGRVQLRIYPGGSAGDEPDILRKMRIGQLNAAALTIEGLSKIDDAFHVFGIPMYFDSEEELTYVLDAMTPILRQRLEDKGFVLLNWGHAGWVHIFSTQPVRSPDDLRARKQFVWAGDERAARWWRKNDFQPVPLAATDIPMALQTGLIEAVPAPPLSVLSFQWFRSAPYMLELGMLPFLGATVISSKTWNKISADDRAQVMAACERVEQHLAKEVPEQEREAIAEMKKRGLEVIASTEGAAPWKPLADRFGDSLRDLIPEEIFERVEALRAEYRERRSAEDDAGGQR